MIKNPMYVVQMIIEYQFSGKMSLGEVLVGRGSYFLPFAILHKVQSKNGIPLVGASFYHIKD